MQLDTLLGVSLLIDSVKPKWKSCHFADNLDEMWLIFIQISLKWAPQGPDDNKLASSLLTRCLSTNFVKLGFM